ncbi:hypothetical protein SAY86_012048 [Trapa natans]|uniref:inositol-1,3,4-trisphosphate 5/6-kinase n=1 Tax=Trapa natans TaxID=22666 RepID=A0AAN7LZA4_TRANT|nr:hypothetical protein SAY86_012048 [Trapa natans]
MQACACLGQVLYGSSTVLRLSSGGIRVAIAIAIAIARTGLCLEAYFHDFPWQSKLQFNLLPFPRQAGRQADLVLLLERARNPGALILDSPDAIDRLHDRISILQVVSELKINSRKELFGFPNQIVIYDKEIFFDEQAWTRLKFSVIAKALVADGSAKSHKILLTFNHEGLKKLKPPIVLQEFVDHSGRTFEMCEAQVFARRSPTSQRIN